MKRPRENTSADREDKKPTLVSGAWWERFVTAIDGPDGWVAVKNRSHRPLVRQKYMPRLVVAVVECNACFARFQTCAKQAFRDRSDDEVLKMRVYEQRLLAETAISRPVMKQFKAFIREQGLFGDMARGGEVDV